MSIMPGSELSAGIAPARLRLYRGGQVRICPRSSLTVNSAPFGIMFAMSAGAIEVDYSLPQRGSEVERASDSFITPDFSVQLAGPGRYHFALASNKQGDTCVKSLPGNSAAIQVSELLNSSSYRIRPQESILFHGGRIDGNTALQADEACGCPEPVAVLRAAAEGSPATKEQTRPQEQPAPVEPTPITGGNPQSSPSPPQKPAGQIHTQVEAPFVFSARDRAGPEPYSIARLTFSSLPNLYFVQETVDPVVLAEEPVVVPVRDQAPSQATPTAQKPLQKKEKKGFFGKLKGFFGAVYTAINGEKYVSARS
jgi:hypothetical protein